MNSSWRGLLTGFVFLAYLTGGLIAPVAHHHCSQDANSSAEQNFTHESCRAGHALCGHTSSEKQSSQDSIPLSPCEDCPACQLLYMATTVVDFVTLPVCEDLVSDVSLQEPTDALLGDIAFPAQRGPPAYLYL